MSVTDSAAEKVARSRAHIAELTGEVNEFLATDPYALECRVRDGGLVHEYFLARDTPTPASIGLLIGDAAHNLRSALDHLAMACAIHGAGRQLKEKEERGIEYPICDKPKAFENALKSHKLKFVEAGPLEIIRRWQPYSFGCKKKAKFHVLSRLQYLDNIDKHRRIATTSYVVTIPTDGLKFVSGGAVPQVDPLLDRPTEGWGLGSVLCRLIFEEPLPDPPLNWIPKFSITIDGDGPGSRRPDELLEEWAGWMETCIMLPIAQWEAGA